MAFETMYTFASYSHAQTPEKIAGKRVWYRYEGGYIYEQHYIDDKYIVWKGIGDEVAEPYTQKERYYCFEIAPELYFITWCEASTIHSPKQMIQYPGAWPVSVVADFNKLIATVSFVDPTENGGKYHVIDQAKLEIKEG